MGDYRIVIEAVGGHGCDRSTKEGGALMPIDGRTEAHLAQCPDCAARQFVQQLAARGGVKTAVFTHWPGEPTEVVDDLLAQTRTKGSFAR